MANGQATKTMTRLETTESDLQTLGTTTIDVKQQISLRYDKIDLELKLAAMTEAIGNLRTQYDARSNHSQS